MHESSSGMQSLLQGSLLESLALLLFVLLINFVIKKALLRLSKQYYAQQKIWHYSFISSLYRPLSAYLWFLAAFFVLRIVIADFLGKTLFKAEEIIIVTTILALGWFLLRWKNSLIAHMRVLSYSKQIEIAAGTVDLVSKATTLAIILFVTLLLMDATGYSIQTLIAFGGISGIALAFASQQVISNFFGGLTVHITQPFSIGERIAIPDRKIEGYVEDIGWYTTTLRDLENGSIYIPNSIFNQNVVNNISRVTFKRIYLKLLLPPQSIQRMEKILQEMRSLFKEHPAIDQTLETRIFFTNFTLASVEIEISAYLLKEFSLEETRQNLLLALTERFSGILTA